MSTVDISASQPPERPWEELHVRIRAADPEALLQYIDRMSPAETARAISRLSQADQTRLFGMLAPVDAAEIIEGIPDTQAADLIEDMAPARAAAILEELASDHLADVLGEMDEEDAEAILGQMAPEDAHEARTLLAYPPDTAGGLMISEYLAFQSDRTLEAVLTDLQRRRDTYAGYHVQYFYVTDQEEKLVGVLRLHDLLFLPRSATLAKVMIRNPLHVLDAALAGADISTIPFKVLSKLAAHPLTDKGISAFLADWDKAQK